MNINFKNLVENVTINSMLLQLNRSPMHVSSHTLALVNAQVSRFGMRKKNSVLFSAWLHSAYLEPGELVLARHQLDKVQTLDTLRNMCKLQDSAASRSQRLILHFGQSTDSVALIIAGC
jgi:hypothetical protein